VISVDSSNLIESVGSVLLAHNASTNHLTSLVKTGRVSGTFDIAARASDVHLIALWKHSRTLYDYTSEFHESIQMDLAEISQLVFYW